MTRSLIGPRRAVVVALTLCGAIVARAQAESLPVVTAFVRVNVVPMDRDRLLEEQTVVVVGDRIQALGPAAEIPVPEGATVVDGGGRFLMPGLVDMHMHLWFEGDLILYVANGVTTVRSLFGGPDHLQWRERIRHGEMFGPTIFTSGPIVDGDPPRWRQSDVATTPETAREIVAAQARAGYDFVKVYDGLSREVYDAVLEAARANGLPVVGHVPKAVGVRHALESHQASIEHLSGYGVAVAPEAEPLASGLERYQDYLGGWTELDELRLVELALRTREAGTWICPTLLALEEFNPPERIAFRLRAPEMRYVAPQVREFWRGTNNDPALVEAAVRAAPGRRRALQAMRDAGVPLLLGTDSPNELLVPGFSVLRELRAMVEAGLSPYEAIVGGTRGPATFLGAMDEFGSVAEGLRADLILIEGNPLEDVTNIARRVGVMLRGEWHSVASLQSRLEELAARYASESTEETRSDE